MDAELAASVVDDAFEAFGTPGCRYLPPAGGAPVTGLTLMRHRPAGERGKAGVMLGRGGFETTDRPQAIIVRAREIAQPSTQGVLIIPMASGLELRFRIGEDPVEDDLWGIAWRCSVERL